MVFNATFNNISVVSWRSVLLVEETGVQAPDRTIDLEIRGLLYYKFFKLISVSPKNCKKEHETSSFN